MMHSIKSSCVENKIKLGLDNFDTSISTRRNFSRREGTGFKIV